MILPVLQAASSHVIEADVPFNHVGLGAVLQAVMFMFACGGFWFNLRKHRTDAEKNARDAEDRIVGALKEKIEEKHRESCDDVDDLGRRVDKVEGIADRNRQICADVADLEKRIEKQENRSEAFLSDAKIKELVHGEVEELKHRMANERQRLDAVVTSRNADVERIVKLETNMVNIEKGQERIEAAVEKNHRETLEAMKAWAEQFSASIREVRDVKPR